MATTTLRPHPRDQRLLMHATETAGEYRFIVDGHVWASTVNGKVIYASEREREVILEGYLSDVDAGFFYSVMNSFDGAVERFISIRN